MPKNKTLFKNAADYFSLIFLVIIVIIVIVFFLLRRAYSIGNINIGNTGNKSLDYIIFKLINNLNNDPSQFGFTMSINYQFKIPEIAKAILNNCESSIVYEEDTTKLDICIDYVKKMLDINGAIDSVYKKDNTKVNQLPIPWKVYNFDCTSIYDNFTQDLIPVFNDISTHITSNIDKIPSTSTIDIEKIRKYIPELTFRVLIYSDCIGKKTSADYMKCADWMIYILDRNNYKNHLKEIPDGWYVYGFSGLTISKQRIIIKKNSLGEDILVDTYDNNKEYEKDFEKIFQLQI